MGPILSYDSISHDMSWNFGLKLKFVLSQKEGWREYKMLTLDWSVMVMSRVDGPLHVKS